ncbi:unnamed protein product [Paramecium primaurelia]|uniref:Uncharacterized protein n=1 Tax=Paramecium primaurelia TaxID=5886 RepID=A0A8S1JWK0_PARPR|nr:unnamed protein product [Paramecium primaurelia]
MLSIPVSIHFSKDLFATESLQFQNRDSRDQSTLNYSSHIFVVIQLSKIGICQSISIKQYCPIQYIAQHYNYIKKFVTKAQILLLEPITKTNPHRMYILAIRFFLWALS